jgi:uncharacterized coiled-coil protein SlyX
MAEPQTLEERVSMLEGKVALLEKVHPDLAVEMSKVDKLRNEMGHLQQNVKDAVAAAEARINRRLDYAAAVGKRDREGIDLFIAQCITKLEWEEFKKSFYLEGWKAVTGNPPKEDHGGKEMEDTFVRHC